MTTTLEFLQNKWAVWFRTLDLKKEGLITRENAEISKKNFLESFHFSPKHANEIAEIINMFWQIYIFKFHDMGPTGVLDEKTFVDNLTREYLADREEFAAFFRRAFKLVFVAIDVNSDGKLSFDEFNAAMKAFEHRDDVITKKIFQSYCPNADGLASIATVVEMWADIVIGEKQDSQNEIVKDFRSDVPDQNVF